LALLKIRKTYVTDPVRLADNACNQAERNLESLQNECIEIEESAIKDGELDPENLKMRLV